MNGAWRLAAERKPAPALPDTVEIPRALRIVTTRALALDPAARYQTAAELGEALERAGADTSDSHARRLGALLSDAFAAEREQRRALIELHMRPTPSSTGGGPALDYESFDVSSAGAPSQEPTPAPELTPTAEPTPTFVAPTRGRALRRTPFVAAASAAIALVVGVHLGKQTDSPRAPARALPTMTTVEPPAAQPEAPPTSVAAATIEPIPEPRDEQAPPAPEHRRTPRPPHVRSTSSRRRPRPRRQPSSPRPRPPAVRREIATTSDRPPSVAIETLAGARPSTNIVAPSGG